MAILKGDKKMEKKSISTQSTTETTDGIRPFLRATK
jgi:hypothetical protein